MISVACLVYHIYKGKVNPSLFCKDEYLLGVHSYPRTHARTHTHIHKHSLSLTLLHTRAHTHTYTLTHSLTHSLAHSLMLFHTHSIFCTITHSLVYSLTLLPTYSLSFTHSCTHTHSHSLSPWPFNFFKRLEIPQKTVNFRSSSLHEALLQSFRFLTCHMPVSLRKLLY